LYCSYGFSKIGTGTIIADNVILGYPSRAELANAGAFDPEKLKRIDGATIGENCILRDFGIIYSKTTIGNEVQTGHHYLVREETKVGSGTLIGSNVIIENHCKIGDNVSIQSGVYIPTYCEIGDGVFLGPYVVLTNDKYIGYKDPRKRGLEGVIIKKKARCLHPDENTSDYILGYSCFNDVTARDLQTKDVQFTRAKSFDTFASIGPCIATDIDPARLRIKTFLNGKLKQSGNTRNLIFSVPFLVRFVSNIMTLNPGDIITTGTPAGIGPMVPGDKVDVQIEGIGTLSNTVMKIWD